MAHWEDEQGQGLVSYGLVLFLVLLISFLVAWFFAGSFVKGGLWCGGLWIGFWLLIQIGELVGDLIAEWFDKNS